MQRLDLISIAGLILSLAAIVGGQVLEGGSIHSLLQLVACFIVLGGTMGATMLQNTLPVFMKGVKLLKWVFFPPRVNPEQMIEEILRWSQISRKEGLLVLEPLINEIEDPFKRKGLQQLVDGSEPSEIRKTMELEINTYEEYHRQAAKVWEGAGGYAPTIGILGAVMGLIHVMENLSDPSKLGGGIAVAFVATIYGVGFANLFFLPAANKIKTVISQQVTIREVYTEGLCALANGENPRIIESKLRSYLV